MRFASFLTALVLAPSATIYAAGALENKHNTMSNSSPVRSTWVNEAQTTRSEP